MFRRGFKAWCERVAANLRMELALQPFDPLPPTLVAESMRVRMIAADALEGVPKDVAKRLLTQHSRNWSAVTVSAGDRHLIVFNSAHSAARQANDLMHELAHLILKHEPSKTFMDPGKGLMIRSYDKGQEDEANWLAAALLLPREALLQLRGRRTPSAAICEKFGVSEELLTMRTRTTGVERQLARRGR
jgi:Zn-dependent peptidase ImmA (M78 family)